MNAPVIAITKEEAKKHYEEYAEQVKVRKEKYLDDLKRVYHALSKGQKVLDIYEVFKQSGVNEQGEPKLGIMRADAKQCVFEKLELGSGRFRETTGAWNEGKEMSAKNFVSLPSNTFPSWPTEMRKETWENQPSAKIKRPKVRTKVPIVPAHLLPSGDLSNYYILFEVTEWNEVPAAKDPFLLKRINDNAFIVLAEWDLTEVEMAVMRGV